MGATQGRNTLSIMFGTATSHTFLGLPTLELEWSPDYHRPRASCLQTMARWLLGPAGTLEALVEHVDSTISLPKDCPIIDSSKRQIFDLAYTMKWPRIRDVILHSLSGPAPLIHWRILVAWLLACPQR